MTSATVERLNSAAALHAHAYWTLAKDIVTGASERAETQRNALLAFSVRCASAAILYLSQIALARWMGSSEYGIYVSVWTWVLILGGLSHLGLNVATMQMLPAYRETSDTARLAGMIRASRTIALGAGTLVMAAGLAGLWLFQDTVANIYVLPMYLALVCIPLYALTDVQDGIGRAHAWMGLALLPPYVLRPLIVLAAMAAAHWAGFEMKASTAAAAAVVATWGAGIIQFLLMNRQWEPRTASVSPTYDISSWLLSSLPLLLIGACDLALQNTDVLAVSHFMTPADAGIYFAAGKTMALIMFVHYAVGSAVAHKFAALNARGDKEGLRTFVKDAVNWTFWPSLACAIVILALGKPLLWLFGPQFEAGYPVMCVLVLGFLIRSAMGPAEYLLNMLGEQALCAGVLLASALLDIALNFALVPRFGLLGAAAATSASLTFAALMCYVAVRRRLDIEIAIWRNIKRA